MDAGGEDGDRKWEMPHINVEDEEELRLYAHKAVLARHSDYFRSLFSERWNQGEEQSMATIDTSGKGGIAKYEKFVHFIYKEPITVASLDLHGILDVLEIASELSCEAIVNACDHFLACVHWPDQIGARLMSLLDKFKCSEELGRRLVEYGYPGYLSTLKQKVVEVWQEHEGGRHPYFCCRHPYFCEAFANFTLMILPIVPEEFVAYTILPALHSQSGAIGKRYYNDILLTIVERSLSKESDASNHLVIAKGLVRCLGKLRWNFGEVEDKLNQLVSKLGEVEQWDVFVVWADKLEHDLPNLHPSWYKFCQHFSHLPAVRDAALKSWHDSKSRVEFAYLTRLLMKMMPEVLVRNFGLLSENWRFCREEKEAQLICKLCTDMLEHVTAGKLLLDASERFALSKQVASLMWVAACVWPEHYKQKDFVITATNSLIKLVKTIPAEKRCDYFLGGFLHDIRWPSFAEAFGPLQGMGESR